MKETITSYVGLDIHKDSIAVAVAEAGRAAPRFVGTTPPQLAALCKALTRSAKRSTTLVVYEAGPCGYGWARHLSAQGWQCEVISLPTSRARPLKNASRPIGSMRSCRLASPVPVTWSKW